LRHNCIFFVNLLFVITSVTIHISQAAQACNHHVVGQTVAVLFTAGDYPYRRPLEIALNSDFIDLKHSLLDNINQCYKIIAALGNIAIEQP